VPLPGGDFPHDGVPVLVAALRGEFRFLDEATALRLVRAYGTDAARLLAGATSAADLGRDFGMGLTEREVRWLMDEEFAATAADVLWRRSKLGLRLSEAEAAALDDWMRSAA
jgi:glycerol-3-phosphate dehydrogenase